MARLRINWKLIIVLIIAVVAMGVTAYGLREWNRGRRSEQGLTQGLEAYEAGRWLEAASNLGRYLGVVADDAEILSKYADAQLKRRPVKRGSIDQAVNAYRRILRLDESYKIDELRREASLRLINLYLQMGIPSEAELIATQQLEAGKDNEIRRMKALALARQRKFTEAAQELNAIIADDPSQVLAYGILGRLTDQRPDDFSVEAAHWFDEAVAKNPDSAQALIMRGDWYLENNKVREAMADFESAEQKDLSDIAVRLSLAGEFVKAGRLEKAEEHLKIAEETEPGNLVLWNTWAILALSLGSEGQIRQAADRGLELLTADDAFSFLPVAAELYVRSGDFEKAAGCIEQLRQQDAEPSLIAFLEGLMAEQKGLWADALKKYRKAAQSGMQTENVELKIASALVRLGDQLSAIGQLRTYVSKNEDSYRGRLALARLLADNGRYAEADEHTRTAIRQQPNKLEGHLFHIQNRIRLLASEKADKNSPLWDVVEADLKKLSETLPDSIAIKTMMAFVAVQRGKLDQAQQMVDKLKEQYPDEIRLTLAEIDVLVAGDKIDEAVNRLRETVKAHGQSSLSVTYLARLLAYQKDYAQCRTVLTDAVGRIEEPSSLATLNLMLAEVYVHDNDIEGACKLLQSALEKMPNDIPLMRRLLRYSHAIALAEDLQPLVDRIKSLEGESGWRWRYEQARLWFALPTEKFDEYMPQGLELLKENITSNPDDQQSRRLLAAFYERSGRMQLAISLYTQAIERSPNDINVIVPAVVMMYKAQRYQQADEILDRAMRLGLGGKTDTRLKRLDFERQRAKGNLGSAGQILENLLSANPESREDRFTLALIRMLQNSHDEARELLTQLRTQSPDDLPVAAGLVELNIRQNRPDDALKICDEMIRLLNNSAAHVLRSRAFIRLGQIEKATEDMEKAVALQSEGSADFVRTLQQKAEFYRSIGKLDVAVVAIDKALAAAGDDFLVQRQAALLLMGSQKKEDVDRGRALMEKALAQRPNDTELLLRKGAILADRGTAPDFAAAEAIFKDVLKQQPMAERAWAMLANIKLSLGDSTGALDTIMNGLVKLPESATLKRMKAGIEARRSPELAIPGLKELTENNPQDTNAAIDLAGAYTRAGMYDEAIELLGKRIVVAQDAAAKRRLETAFAAVIYDSGKTDLANEKFKELYASQPDDSNVLVTHAGALARNKAWGELVDLTVSWCKNYPDKTSVLQAVSQSLVDQKNKEAMRTAEDILAKVLALDNKCLDALGPMAMILHMQDRTDEAARFYERILNLKPDRLVAVNNLAWILCEEQNKYQEALDMVDRGLGQNPNYVDLIDTRGMVYYRMNLYDKAIIEFKKCLTLYPENATGRAGSYFHLGRAQERVGRNSEAVVNLNKAVKIGGLSPSDATEARQLLTKLKG